jgi:predicted MPP superfamily phosphohydrolase
VFVNSSDMSGTVACDLVLSGGTHGSVVDILIEGVFFPA